MIDFFKPFATYSKNYSADLANALEYRSQLMRLLNEALAIYEWEGLPETCDERALELTALMTGQLTMVSDADYGLITPIPGPSGYTTMYGYPDRISIAVYGGDEAALRLSGREYETYIPGADNGKARAVWCRDNRLMYPYINYVLEAASKIADLERAQDVTVNRMKTPWILKCPPGMVDSVERMFKDIDVNRQAIISCDLSQVSQIDIFSTGVNPQTLSDLREHRDEIERRFRELFGITTNSMVDKRERLSVPEVTAGEDIKTLNDDVRLSARQQFAEWCNQLFGTTISVRRRGDDDDLAVADDLRGGDTSADARGGDF